MTLIEGVGDEVVQFVSVLLVLLVAALAWWSTNARPDRYRTVLVMRSRAHSPVTVGIRARSNLMIANAPASSSVPAPTPESAGASTPGTEGASTSGTEGESTPRPEEASTPRPAEASTPRPAGASTPRPAGASTPRPAGASTPRPARQSTRETLVIPMLEMDSIADADMAMLENNRMHFYRRMDAPGNLILPNAPRVEIEPQDEDEPASTAQIREMDSIVSAMEAEATAGCDFFTRPSEINSSLEVESNSTSTSAAASDPAKKDEDKSDGAASASSANRPEGDANAEPTGGEQGTSGGGGAPDQGSARKILIKLKYLNDTLKEVEGSLDEQLKDFKWRHFSTELSSESRVRLIFNGRVLVDDAATLRACGLHDRAVVHCLVHPKRPASQHGAGEEAPLNATHEMITEGPPPERAWDLENILMTLVSVALTVVWFFRCEYSNMFTASASVALFGLTVFYSVAIFGLYLSDTFHLDRRPAQPQPVPNN